MAVLARAALAAFVASIASSCATSSPARAAAAERDTAVDTACAWGRLADGKGRLLRCLTPDEARRLRIAAESSVSAEAPQPAKGVAVAPTAVSPAAPNAAPAPTEPPAAAPPPPAPAESVTPPGTPAPAETALVAEVGPVVADEGALSDAQKGLRKGLERYAECVEKNGGLTADRGEAEIRFLVRGRGRAEGVSVKKRRGMSEAAAKCVADVVDRRYVGFPEAEAVGVSVLISVTKKKR